MSYQMIFGFISWLFGFNPSSRERYLKQHELIKKAVIENDHEKIQKMIQENPYVGNTYIEDIQDSVFMFALQQSTINVHILNHFMNGDLVLCHIRKALIHAISQRDLHHVIPILCRNDVVQKILAVKDSILLLASQYECFSAVEIFVKAGADLNQRDENGYTALMHAAQKNNDVLVNFLVSHGARTVLTLKDGKNPVSEYFHQKNIAASHAEMLLKESVSSPLLFPVFENCTQKNQKRF